MPNPIKYTTGSESDALVKGNFRIGTGSVGKGPSDSTGYYQGPSVPSGGYVIYMNKDGAPGNLSYHSAANDAELISFTNSLAGQSYTTVNECFNYYYGQTDKVLVNQDYPADYPYIVMDGLVLNLDAGISQSYPGSGTVWTDINGLGPKNNVTFFNGPTFDSGNGGSIVFDGTDDYGRIPYNSIWNYNNNITLEAWVMVTSSTSGYQGIFGPFSLSSAYNGFNFSISTGTNKLAFLVGNIPSGAYYVQQNTQYSLNTWYHLVGIINNGTSRLYVNGVLQNDSTSIAVSPAVGPFMLGKFYDGINNFLFGGKIGGGRFYNRVLTQSEITQNYNATKGRFGL